MNVSATTSEKEAQAEGLERPVPVDEQRLAEKPCGPGFAARVVGNQQGLVVLGAESNVGESRNHWDAWLPGARWWKGRFGQSVRRGLRKVGLGVFFVVACVVVGVLTCGAILYWRAGDLWRWVIGRPYEP